MNIIGRTKEKDILGQAVFSEKPEFIVVYGRRRVGKTYLVKEYFNNRFAFYSSGVPNAKGVRSKLKVFHESLIEYGSEEKDAPKDWLEAFRRLKTVLSGTSVTKDPVSGRKIVFIDELPWFDGPKSDFKAALELFWNSWASSQPDLCLIVCGSATSWITNNLLYSKGGFYNRLTRRIHLQPFTLNECKGYFDKNNIDLSNDQIIKYYMVFGGVPYYLDLYDSRMSLDQNINELIFEPTGQLHDEYYMLFRSLFSHPDDHIKVIEALSSSGYGLSRTALSKKTGLNNGRELTSALFDLQQCGFIREYDPYKKNKYGKMYQITDPFTLFYMAFLKDGKIGSWLHFTGTPAYYNWVGHAFEKVCLNHIPQIKTVLGISGIASQEYSWLGETTETRPGAQIDLLIDRADNVIDLCEMKFTEDSFVISKSFRDNMVNKRELFRERTKTRKAVATLLISANGVKRNEYSGTVQHIITGDELFC